MEPRGLVPHLVLVNRHLARHLGSAQQSAGEDESSLAALESRGRATGFLVLSPSLFPRSDQASPTPVSWLLGRWVFGKTCGFRRVESSVS